MIRVMCPNRHIAAHVERHLSAAGIDTVRDGSDVLADGERQAVRLAIPAGVRTGLVFADAS